MGAPKEVRGSGPGRRIRDWPPGERPRELLARKGSRSLSTAQLLGVVIRTGASGPPSSAVGLGRHLMSRYGSLADLDRAPVAELTAISGIGLAKATSIKAAFELGRRLSSDGGASSLRFTSSREVAGYFRPLLHNLSKELFIAALLNGRNELIREVTISVGCLTSSIVHPREVFQPAIREAAAAVLFVHNHPSGDPTPSAEDHRLTRRLVEAGRILGIRVLDHVIVARRGYTSLLDNRGLEST